MIVADCSAIVACLLAGRNLTEPATVLNSFDCVIVPEIADVELVSVLRKMERLRHIDAARASAVLSDYQVSALYARRQAGGRREVRQNPPDPVFGCYTRVRRIRPESCQPVP